MAAKLAMERLETAAELLSEARCDHTLTDAQREARLDRAFLLVHQAMVGVEDMARDVEYWRGKARARLAG